MASSTALGLSSGAHRYERHRPEQTLLYALIEAHYPRFLERLEAEDPLTGRSFEHRRQRVADRMPQPALQD